MHGTRAARRGLATLAAAGLAAAALGAPAWGHAATPLAVTEERQVPQGKHVVHFAVVRNTTPGRVRGLRVTVELRDYFDALLWAKTVSPNPATLRPGETATLSVTAPPLREHRRTRYLFDYR